MLCMRSMHACMEASIGVSRLWMRSVVTYRLKRDARAAAVAVALQSKPWPRAPQCGRPPLPAAHTLAGGFP